MAKPIIVDDGGCTRIRHLDGNGDLPGLLDVDDTAHPPQSSATIVANFVHAKVVGLDEDGVAIPGIDTDVSPGDSFTIKSDHGQSVKLAIGEGGQCTITLLGSSNAPPDVEARQYGGNRRYVVSNAGFIISVQATIDGTHKRFNAERSGSVYTTFMLSKA